MMKRGIGAIIAFERNTGLKSYIDTGTRIDAAVTAELLNTIFTPLTPLHDGAVIIRGETLAAAGCILPLSQDPSLPHVLGMRHRAALGLVEESDAVAVVVSETSKHLCLAADQKLSHDVPVPELRRRLAELLHVKA
jgi:diadenylate cyclase